MAANTNGNMNSVNKFLSQKLVGAVHVVIRVGCHGEVLLLCLYLVSDGSNLIITAHTQGSIIYRALW